MHFATGPLCGPVAKNKEKVQTFKEICLFLHFVINEVQFLIPAVIVQMFNPIV